MAFPDHHAYEPRDLEAVTRRARAVGAGLLVTTEKDAVRLAGPGGAASVGASVTPHRDGEAPLPLWALRVRLEPVVDSPTVPDRGAVEQSRAVDVWRTELRTRVEAAARETRRETSR